MNNISKEIPKEYLIKVGVKNNLIMSKIKEAGFETLASFCKASNLPYTAIISIINFRNSPLKKDGSFCLTVQKLSKALKCSTQDLFTEQQISCLIKKTVFTEISERDINKFLVTYSQSLYLSTCDPSMQLEYSDRNNFLNECMSYLEKKNARCKKIIEMRLDGSTYETISKEIGVTRERVRQIEFTGYRLIRNRFKNIP